MASNNTVFRGRVRRLMPDGYGFVEELNSNRQYIFSLGAISNYRGQTPKELHLHVGSDVEFAAEGDRVFSLNILA